MVGDGFRVHHFLPLNSDHSMQRMSPFFLLDYGSKHHFSPSEKPRGVGVHPHRGFETVTIAFKGRIAHHDSAGNSGVIGEGEIQWMTAGSGVLHKEYHEEEFSRIGGIFQMVQLWVNLPAKDKMTAPRYQSIRADEKGRVSIPNGHVEIIAGNYQNIKGPARTFSPIELYIIKLAVNGQFEYELPADFNVCILAVEGSVKVNEDNIRIPEDHLAIFHNDGSAIKLLADEESTLLLMAGRPIHEPIAAYGPFLMNHPEEIRQAYEDYKNGKFGNLID
jgi:quercetin 2,3-dioxygenase